MMDHARTECFEWKFNNKFKQLADDFGFTIVPCIRARPNTKAKVENPMRIINEIMNYNDVVKNLEQLHKKMSAITNGSNSRICQATGLPPILVFNKEKEHLLPLQNDKVCSFHKNIGTSVKVAGFPHLKELKDFYFNFQPKINKKQFLDFESLRFLESNNNIILIGNSGIGKTRLATSIGIDAAKKRISTYFIKFHDLID